MDDTDFDSALIGAFFTLVAEQGWRRASVPAAARAAGLALATARERFPCRAALLTRFGRMVDQAALAAVPTEGLVRDRLFDLLMHRFDVLQAHRGGVVAMMHALPFDPAAAMLLSCATRRSMRWMLEAAGAAAHGIRGELQVRGLIAVWLWALRAWEKDDSADLSGTMAALDAALARAAQATAWLSSRRDAPEVDDPGPAEPPSGEA